MSDYQRTRRQMLRTVSVAGGVAAMYGASTMRVAAEPKGRRGVTTFLFVNGSHGGTFALNELGLLGHRPVAVELPGHSATDTQFDGSYQAPQDLATLATKPSPMRGITLDDFVATTVQVVRKVARHGPVVLVGMSMGGATISRVGNLVPHLLDRIVYLSAFCCVELPSCVDYMGTPEGSTSLLGDLPGIGDPEQLGASRANWRSADPEYLTKAKAALMAGAGDAEFLAVLNTLHPDESIQAPFADARVDPKTWGRVPHTYVRFTEDRAIPLALQDRMIAEADRAATREKFDVRSVPAPHIPTAATWPEIVRILDGLAR